MRRNFFLILLIVFSFSVKAQDIKSQPVSRILKTATSLLEAQQYEAAEEYFNIGLKNAKAKFDVYYQAQA